MSGSLAPGFVVASPPLGDPNFDRTVVLLALHGPRGALGFIINRVAPMSLEEVLRLAGYPDAKPQSTSTGVLSGGPVEPGSGWVLSRDTGSFPIGENTIEIGDGLRVCSSRAAFDSVASGVTSDSVVILGYSGWGPGQLESEMAHGAWLPVPFHESIVFDVAIGERWNEAHKLLGITPFSGLGMRTVGSA